MRNPIIESKIKSPATYPNYLRRSAASSKLKQLYRSPLTIIHGGAGYGKTSLLSHVLHDEKKLFSWYTAGEEDDDIQPFLLYLMASIERVIPGIDREFKDKRIITRFPKPTDIQNWVTYFIDALSVIDEEFVIVIDDYHTIDHVFSINFFLEKVIALLPESVHLVISTRQKPKWSNLLKLRSSGRLIEVTTTDLQFQPDEIHYFYEDSYQLQLSSQDVEEVYRVTEGWAIAVQLVGSYLSEINQTNFSLPALPTDELFHYLAQEVIAKRPEGEQRMLYQLSLMESFDHQAVIHFYGEEGIVILHDFLRAHMFIHQIGASHYRFHALFHRFLQTTFRSEWPELWLEHHQQLADFYMNEMNMIQAMNHYRTLNQPEQLAQKTAIHGEQLISLGQFDYLEDLLNHIPNELKNHYYQLYYLLGEVLRYKAFYEKAKQAYLDCASRASESQNLLLEAQSYIGVASIYIDTIQPLYAEPYLDQALKLAENTQFIQQSIVDEWKCLRVENLVNLGQAAEAERFMDRFAMNIEDLPVHNTDVRLHLRRGRLSEAKAMILQKKQHSALPEMFREGTVLASFIHAMLGEEEQAMRLAERGIKHGQEEKSVYVEAVGLVRMGHAYLIAPIRNLDEAYSCYSKAIELLGSYDLHRAKAEPLLGLATVYTWQGLYQQAEEAYNVAIRETEKVHDNWLSAYLFMGKGQLKERQGNINEALDCFRHALTSYEQCGDAFGEFVSLFYLSHCQWKQDNEVHVEQALRLISLLKQFPFEFLFTRHSLFGPEDPASTLPFWFNTLEQLEDVHKNELIRKMGLSGTVRPVSYTLHVKVLGAFRIARGPNLISEKEWQREKAKELFVMLLMHRGRYVSKQEIYEGLWPDLDIDQAERDFKVTYNALLKVIEPAREPRQESFFIERRGILYRIRPEACVIADIDEWKAELERADEAREPKRQLEHLKRALRFYQGEFFGERPVESKAIRREQEILRNQYLEAMERVAQLYTRLQNYNKVIYWAERLISEDATWEEAYRLLMFAYYHKKNRKRALELYAACQKILSEELGVSPMETTENMYELIRL